MMQRVPTSGATRGAYACLAILFVLVMASEIPFTIDLVRAEAHQNVARPVAIGSPWPSVVWVGNGASAAGLRVGDRIAAIAGRPVRGYWDLSIALRGKKGGDTVAIAVDRAGRVTEFQVGLQPVAPWLPFAIIALIVMPWLSISLGFWVAFLRPLDKRAWLVLGILLGVSHLLRPGDFDYRNWPVAIAAVSTFVIGIATSAWVICMMLFGIYFPQHWRREERVPWLKWVLILSIGAVGLDQGLRDAVSLIDRPAALRLFPYLVSDTVQMILMMVANSIFFAGIFSKYQDESMAADDRRRLRILYFGCSVALTPLFLITLYSLISRNGVGDGLLLALSFMAVVVFPITMAYVIVVQRALDVRMVIRQGVQYALARRGVVVLRVLVSIAVISLSVSLAGSRGVNAPQGIILMAVGFTVVFLIGPQAKRLSLWVDRRFFREAYDSDQILGELSEQVRTILDKDSLLRTVTRKLSESLHVERVAVMLLEGGRFRPAFATGYGAPLDVEFAAGTPTVAELNRSREPVAAEGPAVDGDREALGKLDAQLLLPLASRKELLGFISLGPKKSEEPYSSSDTRLLRTVAAHTGMALENSRLTEAIASEMAQRELLHREIEIAREVQERLFPQNMPGIPSLEYAGHCRPARGVGGDYYDFLALSSGRLGLAIGDVSGKGVPAALLMASLQASVRGQSQSGSDVAGLMTNVNLLVCDASPANRYATFFYAQFDPATKRLVYTNGGHNPPVLLRGDAVIRLENGGPPVGLFRASRYEQDEIELQPGDLLVLFTDGISEAENTAEEEWGEEALIATARSCHGMLPSQTIARIMDAADAFAGGVPQHDDMTLVIARVLDV